MKKDSSRPAPWTVAIIVLGLTVAAWPASEQEGNQPASLPAPEREGNESASLPASEQEGDEPASLPASERESDEPARQDPWAEYEVILERNMFSRQRGYRRRNEREERQERAVVMPNPESYLKFNGAVQEDGTFIAFVEDTRSGTVLRLRAGDRVARGVIKTLTLDSLVYELGDKTTTVQLGFDLEGGRGAVTMTELMEYSGTAAASPTGEPAQSEAPTGEAADILQQLLQRRQQELGK